MEPVRLDPAAIQGPGSAAAGDLLRLLKPGDTVSARVLGAVGAGPEGTLYALAFRGQTLVAESAADLAPDSVVKLLVAQAGQQGAPLLRLLAASAAPTGNPGQPSPGGGTLLATPQRLAELGLPPADALAAQVLDAFAEAEAPLAPARLQIALAAVRQAPAAQAPRLARAHAELARAGLPATPALVALAERAVSELLPNSGATLRSAQRALPASPEVQDDGFAAAESGDEPASSPRAVQGRAQAGAPAGAPAGVPAGAAARAPASAPAPQEASAVPASSSRPQASPQSGRPAPSAVPPTGGMISPPDEASSEAAASRPAVALRAQAAAVAPPGGTPAARTREAVPAGPVSARPSSAPVLSPAAADPARGQAPPSGQPAAAQAASSARAVGAPSSPAEVRPSPAQTSGPPTPTPAVAEARVPVAAPPAPQGDPAGRAVPASPPPLLRQAAPAAPDLRAALETLRTLELPDVERGGLPAVLAALRLAGVRAIPAGAVVANATTAAPEPERQDGADAGALHRQIGRAGAALAALPPQAQAPAPAAATSPPPPPPEPVAMPPALVQAAREQLADQVFRPRELADYDRVVPLPLQAQGQPTPARLAVAMRTSAGGQKAAFLRVDAELSELGPVSLRLSGVEGGPLAVTLIAEGAGARHLADALPELAADLRALNIDAAIRVVATDEAAP